MAKLQFGDIIALAKAGYTPSDVRSLLELSTQEAEQQQPENNSDLVEGAGQESNNREQQREESSDIEQNRGMGASGADAGVDYKLLYEESQRKLAEAQKANTQQNIQHDEVNNEDQIADMMRAFM